MGRRLGYVVHCEEVLKAYAAPAPTSRLRRPSRAIYKSALSSSFLSCSPHQLKQSTQSLFNKFQRLLLIDNVLLSFTTFIYLYIGFPTTGRVPHNFFVTTSTSFHISETY